MTASEGDPPAAAPTAVVITVSTRASAGVYEDRSGPIIADVLAELGFEVWGPRVVPDGVAVGAALRTAIQDGAAVVITSGGTGLNPNDHTPEQTAAVIERSLPHLAAEISRYGVQHGVPTAMLSRGLAGTAGRTLVVNLPGSSGGARDGMAVLRPVLVHAIDQLRGGDH
ncbi:MogA/MoaB family molybdenum cofactor biosynthesis protein [Microlunatus ginsengisoli]|uniref:MogA/MoaB family molybdenum cofactor biosynthesis protein n=1 Tax=Microlunatus ginsengisoli TaxID=363863 RepID=A0ABP7AV34_9ACTN